MQDLIDRQAAIDALEKLSANYTGVGKREWHPHVRECQYEIQHMPSAQPETDSFCTDCKEYDSERNFCPRFDRVIKKTVEEMQIIRCGECKHWKNDHLCEVLSRFGTFETEVYFYCGFAERRGE